MDAEELGPTLKVFGTVLKAGAQFKSAGSLESIGRTQQQALEFEADQLLTKAGQTRASAQRKAISEKKAGELVGSRLVAVAGAGAGDPTVVKLAGEIAAETDFRRLTALFTGEEIARGLEGVAAVRKFEGAEAMRIGETRAGKQKPKSFTTLLKGFEELSAFDKFGEEVDTEEFDPAAEFDDF